MTPWEVIQQALARHEPPQSQEWLAKELSRTTGEKITAQAISNWKGRGVPPKQFRALAKVFGLTVDQIEGIEPLPWADEVVWPFPTVDRDDYQRLTPRQKREVEDKLREMVSGFLPSVASPALGKSPALLGAAKRR